jgi:hypothetical protein
VLNAPAIDASHDEGRGDPDWKAAAPEGRGFQALRSFAAGVVRTSKGPFQNTGRQATQNSLNSRSPTNLCELCGFCVHRRDFTTRRVLESGLALAHHGALDSALFSMVSCRPSDLEDRRTYRLRARRALRRVSPEPRRRRKGPHYIETENVLGPPDQRKNTEDTEQEHGGPRPDCSVPEIPRVLPWFSVRVRELRVGALAQTGLVRHQPDRCRLTLFYNLAAPA